jgi:hypothetical protein
LERGGDEETGKVIKRGWKRRKRGRREEGGARREEGGRRGRGKRRGKEKEGARQRKTCFVRGVLVPCVPATRWSKPVDQVL